MMDRKADSAPGVLVTGAAGFIGQHLVRRMCDLGKRVVALDVRELPLGAIESSADYHVVDIRDAARVRPLLDGIETVFHLASVHLEVHTAEAVFEQVNVRAAEQLVELCAGAGVRRFVHTSSVGVYGHVAQPPAREDAAKAPQTPYERTKLAGELAVIRRAEQAGVELVVLRPAWVFGPGCRRTAKLLRSVRSGAFFYIGRGDNLRHPIYVGDLVDAFVLAAEVITNGGPCVYNIAGPAAVTVHEMVETCARVMGVQAPAFHLPRSAGWFAGALTEAVFRPIGREPPFSRRTLAFFCNDNAFSTEAAERELGFRPRVDLETGLRQTLAHLQAA